jgi:anti-sigma factor RsiW
MNCQQALDLLSPYIDDRLPAVSVLQLEAHLAGCADCQAELQALAGTSRLLGALTRPALAIDLAPAVLARAGTGRTWITARRNFMMHQFARAMLILVLFLLATSSFSRNLSASAANEYLSWPTRLVSQAEGKIAEAGTQIDATRQGLMQKAKAAVAGQFRRVWGGGRDDQESRSNKHE